MLISNTYFVTFHVSQFISPDEDDGVNISANPFKNGGPGGPGSSVEDMMIDGPKIPIEELISLVRHSKLATIKDALDYMPNKKFDKSLVQVRYYFKIGSIFRFINMYFYASWCVLYHRCHLFPTSERYTSTATTAFRSI